MTGPCTVPGCGTVARLRRGLCPKHYQRLRAAGDVGTVRPPGRKPTPTPKAVVQCGDCGALLGATQDPRGIWTLLAAHRCEVAS